MNKAHIGIIISLFYATNTSPQEAETTALELTNPVTSPPLGENVTDPPKITKNNTDSRKHIKYEVARVNIDADLSFGDWLFNIIRDPIVRFVEAPKVKSVMKNIGTCMVNGAMDLVSYYLPPPFMPLIATLAGLVIPFEPVVMLKEKMPVNSYRRAFKTAMSTFLNTFDQYKMGEEDYDPYMTRRFNRRVMDMDKKQQY